MKTVPVALSLALCTCLISTSVHGADPHDTWMKLIVGKWSAEGTDGRKWEVEVKPLLDGKALTVAVANDDGTSGAGLIGWEPDTKKFVETGYGSDGGYWHLTYTSVTDDELRGQRTALMADGTKQIGNWHVWREGDDIVHWSFDGKDDKGQEVKFTGKHTRNTQDTAREAIVQIEKQWAKAMVDGDAEWFKKMLTDDFRIVLPEGQVWNRAEFADAWATGNPM